MTSAGGLPEPLLDVATGVCQNVALGIDLTVVTREGDARIDDPGGQIAEVRVDVIMGNVSATVTGGRILAQQAFSVKFRNIATAVRCEPNEHLALMSLPGTMGGGRGGVVASAVLQSLGTHATTMQRECRLTRCR